MLIAYTTKILLSKTLRPYVVIFVLFSWFHGLDIAHHALHHLTHIQYTSVYVIAELPKNNCISDKFTNCALGNCACNHFINICCIITEKLGNGSSQHTTKLLVSASVCVLRRTMSMLLNNSATIRHPVPQKMRHKSCTNFMERAK